MKISYDESKRSQTLAERGLDFEDAPAVFGGPRYTVADDRKQYGEQRFQTYGLLRDRLVILIWDVARRTSPHHFDEKVQ